MTSRFSKILISLLLCTTTFLAVADKNWQSVNPEKIAEAKLEILDGMENGTLLVPLSEPLLKSNCAKVCA